MLFLQSDRPGEQLQSFSQDRTETIQSLVDIDLKKEECLNAFLSCQSLVEWLKSSLPGLLINIICTLTVIIVNSVFAVSHT